jgi:hypothetical protein
MAKSSITVVVRETDARKPNKARAKEGAVVTMEILFVGWQP